MEILKKSLLVILFVGTQWVNAQDQKATQEAFSKSYTLETGKKYNEAIDILKSLNASQNYAVQLRLGWLLYTAKRYDESVAAYKKATEIMPASVEPLLALVNPLATQKKWDEVEKNHLNILKIDPKNSLTNFRLGQIYYNKKEYAKAEKYFSISLNLYPFDYDSMLMSGWNYYFLGKYSEAKELFNRVLLYSPFDTSATEGLGLIK
ncbi:tetratricopeptide repeat protein [Flavobacterium sp.]|uniref:tetratricopeptide repeat protein n=1 Tax=Flavobacterium sp. TaxID=239 RepID=UPI00286E61F4|nr:tetratricopeptide repeat protein [Flavobacterium sp.]